MGVRVTDGSLGGEVGASSRSREHESHAGTLGLRQVEPLADLHSFDGHNAVSYQYIVGDVPSATRYTDKVLPSGPLNNRSYGLLWLSNIGGIFTGAYTMVNSLRERHISQSLGDGFGEAYHTSVFVRGFFEFFTGGIFTTYAANAAFGFLAPAIAAAVLIGGIVAGCGTFGMFAVHFGMRADEMRTYAEKVDAILNDPKTPDKQTRIANAFEYIRSTVRLSDEELESIVAGVDFEQFISETPSEETIEQQVEALKQFVNPETLLRVLEKSKDVDGLKIHDVKKRGLQKQELVLDSLWRGVLLKHARVTRVLDGTAVTRILSAKECEQEETVTKVQRQAKWNFGVFAAISAVSLFAVGTFILLGVAHGGMLAHVANALMLTTGISLTIVDAYFIVLTLLYGKPSKTDQLIMTAMTAALVACAIAVVILAPNPATAAIGYAMIAWYISLYIAAQIAWARKHAVVDQEALGAA